METETHPDGINYKNKTTMKNYYIMVVAATIVLSSCSNEKDIILDENNSTVSVFTATIENATRATLEGQTPTWEINDQISINGKIYEAQEAGSSVSFSATGEAAEGSTYFAYFPASLYDGTTATLPASYTYQEGKFNMPMYAESSTTDLNFKNICAVLAITIPESQISTVNSIEVSSNEQINGAFTADATGVLTFSTISLTEDNKKITLNFTSPAAITGSKTFYLPIPANRHHPLTIKVSDGTETKTMVTKNVYTHTEPGVTVVRNNIYSVNFASNTGENILPGIFSVSSTKKVRFSKANIYWNGTALHFESDQRVPVQYPRDAPNHMGGFFWSRDFSISTAATYSDPTRAYGDKLWISENNKQTIDGTPDLYVLTNDEWEYLIKGSNRTGKYAQSVYINGIRHHVVLAPDECIGSYEFDNTKTEYTLEEWAEAEVAGVICLPPFVDNYYGETDYAEACCWTSTEDGGGSSPWHARRVVYNYYIALTTGRTDRGDRYAIRLVQTYSE